MAECLLLNGGGNGNMSDEVTATKAQVLKGYTAITSDSNDEPVEGTIPTKAAATYNTSLSDQTIPAGQYTGGAQTIKAVTTSNISAGNIKKGVAVKVGDANNAGRIEDVTGTYTTVSSGQSALTAATLRKGYSGFANGGGEVKGNMTEKAAATYNTSKTDQTIAANQYLTGAQTIKAVTTANISAGNIKRGVRVTVGDANDADRIASVAGTYSTVSSGQTALTAASLRKGYSGFANGGGEVKGNMPEKGAATYYATTSEQTINAGQYLAGAQKIGKLSQTNLSSGNVRKGVSIYINNGNANVFSATGTWYGNKKTIGACAWCGRGLGDPNPSETQSFTMPDSGTVYYGGMSSGYYGGSGNCRIYKNNSVVDNRDLGTYYVRGSMFNKSFAANKGDVIKVEATATSGDATVTCIQAVIVY